MLLDSGEIVTCDVAVRDGIIAAIGTGLPAAEVEVDAAGQLVAPGVVDPHVHFGNTMPFLDEVGQDTGSALAGGVTTVGCFLRSTEPYSATLGKLISEIEQRSFVDMFLHLQVFTDEQIGDLARCHRQFGITSFKFYLSGIPGIVDSVDEATLLHGMETISALGPGGVVAVHCENKSVNDSTRAELEASGGAARSPAEPELVTWERAHTELAEVLGIETAAAIAEAAGVRLYVVHLSSGGGLAHVRALHQRGVDVVVETTSAYLGLQDDDPNGLLLKMVPPIRDAATRQALWSGVADGSIQTIGTDNTARSRESKNPSGGVLGARPGYPMLATHLPAVLTYGHFRQQIPLPVLWRAISAAPAEVFGLFPRKGAIRPGSDGDLVIVDLDRERTVVPAELGSFSDFSPFEGKPLRGWPRTVIKSGRVVAEDGRLLGPAGARYLARGPGHD